MWLGEHVSKLAEWSCEQVCEQVCKSGDQHQWVASYDGFYLTEAITQIVPLQRCMTTQLGALHGSNTGQREVLVTTGRECLVVQRVICSMRSSGK